MKKIITYLFSGFLLLSTSLIAQNSWVPKSSFPSDGRNITASFVIGDKFYTGTGLNVSGHLDDFWEYNSTTDQWTQKANFPGGSRKAATGFSIGSKGYICFGSNTPGYDGWTWYKDVWEYDPSADSWTRKNDFPGHERYMAVAFVIGNKAYVGNGYYKYNPWTNSDFYNDFWEYDPSTDNWTQKTNVPEEGRSGSLAMEIGGKGYIGFGYSYSDTRKKDWWQYDATSDSWTRKADFPGESRVNAMGFSMNNKGYVGCGYSLNHYSFFSDFYVYIPVTDSWVQKTNFPGTPRYGGIGFSIGNKGYMGMGAESNSYPQDLWQYSDELEPVTITCPPDQSAYITRREGCDQLVTNLAPIFTPSNANPAVHWSNIWRGFKIRSGSGILQSLLFPAGSHLLIYTLPEYEGQVCSVEVKIMDTFPPIAVAPPDQQFCYNPTNHYSIPLFLNFSDNCGIVGDFLYGAFIGFTITGATNRSDSTPEASGYFNPGTSIITWTARDAAGNETKVQTVVKVDPPLTVNIPNSYAVLFGEPNTVYKGYGPDGIFLTAMPRGGTKFPNNTYNFHWSNGANTRTIWVNQPSIGTHNYYVTVTDAFGCSTIDDITINVKDVRCGPQLNKVAVCFNSRQGQIDRCLKPSEAFFALLWGGKLGTCDQLLTSAQSGKIQESIAGQLEKSIQVYPNPAKNAIRVLLNNYPSGQYEVGIWDMIGKKINQKSVYVQQSNYQMVFNLENQANGIYLIRVSGKEGTQTYKVVKH